MSRTTLSTVTAALLCSALSACGGAGGDAPPAQPDGEPGKFVEPVPGATGQAPGAPPVTGEVPDALLNLVFDHLEAEGHGTRAEFRVLLGAYREWPDGAMGCARPDEMVTHAPVRGYHLIIGARGARFDYRVSEDGALRLCKPGQPARPGTRAPAM